ncbi:nucleoside hydrolase [Arenibaculum pallidiluteum]|uniref:nucleoside hydrolase n=1 Tax=Arenibaculum pallidiluteum TaxID=2812559 RepID=UPI001A959E1C|nr:nucleoside hydrolase [Arenibaculum pallidiluteum]
MIPRKLILDVDTGTDDAVAIMLAALHPALDLVGVTVVNGNLPVETCTDNTLRVLDHVGRSDVPVFEGADRPLVRTDFPIPRGSGEQGARYHGETLPIPATRRRKERSTAVEFLVETYRAATEPITLVPVGTLTNIAAALAAEPRLASLVPEVVIMGGGHEIGNVTPAAEFNIWGDPEAAARVLGAGFPKVTLVLLDATHKALVSYSDCERLAALGTPAGMATSEIVRFRIDTHEKWQKMPIAGTAPVHDALCVAFLVDRGILATRRLNVVVETAGTYTLGRTVIDVHRRSGREPNADVAFDADARRFVDLLAETFARSGE